MFRAIIVLLFLLDAFIFNVPVDFVEEWPMVNPNEMALILVTYLVFVLKVGPIFMERRPPFPIKGFLVVYNAIKAVNSTILAFKVRMLLGLDNNHIKFPIYDVYFIYSFI